MSIFPELQSRIVKASKVLIMIHEDPDGDAIGSGVALALALKAQGKLVCIPFSGFIQETAMSLNPLDELDTDIPANFIPDLVVILDSSSMLRLGKYAHHPYFEDTDIVTINIDHLLQRWKLQHI